MLEHGNKRVYNCDVYCGKLVECMEMGVRLSDVEQVRFYHA